MKQTLRDETYKRLCSLVRSRPELKVMIWKPGLLTLIAKLRDLHWRKNVFCIHLIFLTHTYLTHTHTHTHTHTPMSGVACVIFIILISYLGWLGWNILCNKGSFLFSHIFPECIPWDPTFSIFLRWGWGGGLTFGEMSYKVASLCLFRHLKDVLEKLWKVTLFNWQQEDQTKDE